MAVRRNLYCLATRLLQPPDNRRKIFRRLAEIMVRDHHPGRRKFAFELSSRHVLGCLDFHVTPIDAAVSRLAQDFQLLFPRAFKRAAALASPACSDQDGVRARAFQPSQESVAFPCWAEVIEAQFQSSGASQRRSNLQYHLARSIRSDDPAHTIPPKETLQ
jgi:hypothetical protein